MTAIRQAAFPARRPAAGQRRWFRSSTERYEIRMLARIARAASSALV
jgi:hypothetical protein